MAAMLAVFAAGCGGSHGLSASSTCQQFLDASQRDADHAVLSLAGRLHAPDATTPLGRPEVNYACASDPSKTLGQVLLAIGKASGGSSAAGGSSTTTVRSALQHAFANGSGTSLATLQRQAHAHPNSAAVWRNLATAYEQHQKTAAAISALSRYVALQPNDTGALSELASEWTQQANTLQHQHRTTALHSAERQAENVSKRLAAAKPNDATAQLQLGQAAQSAGDIATARTAYRAFLRLAPDDPLVPQLRQALASLH